MPTTPTFGIPYPALSDPPNGASQMNSLATTVENTIISQIATVNGSITAAAAVNEQLLSGVSLAQVGTYLTTSGTTELNLAKLAVSGINYGSTDVLKFTVLARFSGGAAGDTFEVRIRQTTALSGTLLKSGRVIVDSANQFNKVIELPWVPGSSGTNQSFFVSLVKIVGSGNLAVEGDNNTQHILTKIGTTARYTLVP